MNFQKKLNDCVVENEKKLDIFIKFANERFPKKMTRSNRREIYIDFFFIYYLQLFIHYLTLLPPDSHEDPISFEACLSVGQSRAIELGFPFCCYCNFIIIAYYTALCAIGKPYIIKIWMSSFVLKTSILKLITSLFFLLWIRHFLLKCLRNSFSFRKRHIWKCFKILAKKSEIFRTSSLMN